MKEPSKLTLLNLDLSPTTSTISKNKDALSKKPSNIKERDLPL